MRGIEPLSGKQVIRRVQA